MIEWYCLLVGGVIPVLLPGATQTLVKTVSAELSVLFPEDMQASVPMTLCVLLLRFAIYRLDLHLISLTVRGVPGCSRSERPPAT